MFNSKFALGCNVLVTAELEVGRCETCRVIEAAAQGKVGRGSAWHRFLFINTLSLFFPFLLCQQVIPPGGNTSFDVVFLARVVGNVENTLFINTSHHGVFTYQVSERPES